MGNTFKKLLPLICAILCVVFLALAVFGAVKGAGIDPVDARNSIVWVYETLQLSSGEVISAGSGTGWAIGKPGQPVEYIVTNGHVVADAYEYPKLYPKECTGDVRVVFSAAENDFVFAQVVYYSPPDKKDLAILKLPSPTGKRTPLALRASDGVKVGEAAYALGYPGVASDMQAYTTFDVKDITVTKGIISKRTFVSGVDYEAFQMDVYINHGNSGGPLVDDKGFAIGVNTLGNYDSQSGQMTDMNYAIVMDELIRILDAERLPYAVKGEFAWMIYLFGALCLAAGAAAFLLYQRGKAGGSGAPQKPGKEKGRKGKSPVLRCVGGVYAGQTFAMEARLTLGRDPQVCNIVFDANTPGVSGTHCAVWHDAREDCFMIQDNGSSYGTFLMSGKKLAANVPERLKDGDGFFLADGANRFTVGLE